MGNYLNKLFILAAIALLFVSCFKGNEINCIPSDEEFVHITRVYFTGNNIDSLDRWDFGKVCENYEMGILKTPIDVYEVSFFESANCDCLFINEINPAYCEVPYEMISGTYTLDNYRWDILYAFDGDIIYHPPCGYMEYPAEFRTSGEVWDKTDFLISGTIGGNSYGYRFTDLDRESRSMLFMGLGGIQAEGQAHGAAFNRNASLIFAVGNRIAQYYFDNNLLYLINANGTGGMVFQAREIL